MNKIIAQGAEATIVRTSSTTVTKKRIEKSYRYPDLDNKLRKLRTRQEAKLIEKASSLIPTPKIISINEENKQLTLSYIPGKKLAENLEKLELAKVCKQIGQNVSRLHEANIIHGDLTTSNMIYSPKQKKVYFIDFGLGFQSAKDEDKAVDLHVLKEALQARHPTVYEKAWKIIAKAYDNKTVLNRLEKVERRGRYKTQF